MKRTFKVRVGGLFGPSSYESTMESSDPPAWPWPSEKVELAQRERDRYIRLFNRLEAAISHHKKAHLPEGLCFVDDPDEALWAARDRVLADAANGKG